MSHTAKVISIFTSLALSLLPASALSSDEALELLKKTDASTSFEDTDFSANYAIVQDKPGQGKNARDAVMYRRDSKASYTILITGPAADKGKGYFQADNNIWFYDPADHQFVFTAAKDRFEGTDANNSDFAPQHFSRDFKIDDAQEVKLGKLNCVLFTLSATVKNVDYPMIKLWVTRDDGLIRKKEDYSLSKQLLRTTAIPSYQKVEGRSVPVNMLIVDNLRGKKIDGKVQYQKTQITISNVSFKKQNDAVFTKKYVEMMGAS